MTLNLPNNPVKFDGFKLRKVTVSHCYVSRDRFVSAGISTCIFERSHMNQAQTNWYNLLNELKIASGINLRVP